MIVNLLKYLAMRSRAFIMTLGFELVLLLGIFDYLTGPDLSFSIFYVIPIALVAWFARRSMAILMSILSAATWLLADLAAGGSYSHQLIPFWNMIVRFGFFITVTLTLAALRQALEREQALARTDSLTGVATGRYFSELATVHVNNARRHNRPLTIAYIDLDNFKTINDRFGHHTGDALLRVVAEAMEKNIRATDIISRLGGDEFAILLPETGAEAAEVILRKIQNLLSETMRRHEWPVTFSIGAVTFLTPPRSVDELIKAADDLMYSAKNSGKNMIKHEISKS